jgi:hypothetical protein
MNFEEIEKVQIGKKADFTSELKNNSKDYSFHCKNCDNILKMNYENQIDNCWTGHSNKIEKELYEELKKFYNIGLFNKSIDGGFPVFDKIKCEKCKIEYITYSGVNEYYNSLYYVILNGILKENITIVEQQ